ncbi:helix-turn-helix domain-containing protein [Amycolatopsis japonica]|uniref:helix-turn-helix domain-containing protein n=1 Tax=Amycolatopsis japonica TaxID=208439 RepID=UPI00366DFA5F
MTKGKKTGKPAGIPVPHAEALPDWIGPPDGPAVTVGAAVGENVRQLRATQGVTQGELARMLATLGSKWTKARVFALEAEGESARESVTLNELLELSIVFRVPLDELVDGPGDVRLSSRVSANRHELAEAIRQGRPPNYTAEHPAITDPAGAEIAERLSASEKAVLAAAQRLYGRTATEERAQRVGAGDDAASAYRQRNFTQQIEAEIREEINVE